MAVLAFAVEGAPRPAQWRVTAWTALLYLGLLASVVAFWLNYWLLRRMDASTMSMMGVAEVPGRLEGRFAARRGWHMRAHVRRIWHTSVPRLSAEMRNWIRKCFFCGRLRDTAEMAWVTQ